MRHFLFAVFDTSEQATLAAESVRTVAAPDDRVGVLLHEGHLRTEELPVGETAARQAGVITALIGAILGGTIGGFVLAPGGFAGSVGMAIGLTALAGALAGAVFGTLAGVGGPDHSLHKLESELKSGHVLVSVDTSNLELMRKVEHTLADLGGKVLVRPAI